jgi:two-component system chemotaxis response regulator CheB
LVVVQEPGEAAHPSMPQAALAAAPGAIAAPVTKLGEVVGEMLSTWPRPGQEVAELRMEDSIDRQFLSAGGTRLACPGCGGALAEVVLPRITYYRCHVGHQFGRQSLAAAQAEAAKAKLRAAVAALEETAALARHLAALTALGGGAAGRPGRTADWAARIAESLPAQVQETPEG